MKQTLAIALFAFVAAPALASGGAVATPAPVVASCTQLELSIGLRGADCGRYTVGEIILMDETANQD